MDLYTSSLCVFFQVDSGCRRYVQNGQIQLVKDEGQLEVIQLESAAPAPALRQDAAAQDGGSGFLTAPRACAGLGGSLQRALSCQSAHALSPTRSCPRTGGPLGEPQSFPLGTRRRQHTPL